MIALKLVFQSLAGVGALITVASGSVYVMNTSHEHFYLVSVDITSTSIPSKELWTATSVSAPTTENNKVQNYRCEASTTEKEEDKDCKLYQIAFDNTNKSIDLSKLQEFVKQEGKETTEITKATEKSKLTTNKFFLLKTSSVIWSAMKNDATKIKVLSNEKDTTESVKIYATLTVHAEINESKAIGKINLVIGKVTTANSTQANGETPGATTTYKCKFKKKNNEAKECKVIALTKPTPSSSDDFKKINFSTTKLGVAQVKTIHPFTQGDYFLIEWTGGTKYQISSLKDEVVVLVETTTSSETDVSTETTDFSLESAIFAHPISSEVLTEVVILK